MDVWKKYKSPLGYYNNDNQIDSYGVDHSGFSIRDELNYQFARVKRENDLIKQFQNQGLKIFPQYGTNFWNEPTDNSYAFGIANIEIQPNTTRPSYTTESAWGYPNNSYSSFYNKMGRPYNLRPNQYKLGTLSGLYESNNGKKLWNNGNLDKTGGWSYGTYQIATQNGTMNDYLTYLQGRQKYQDFYDKLQQAGGQDTALRGDLLFKKAWADLSENEDFLQSQQDFIVDKKLMPALNKIRDIKGLNFKERSPVLKDVLYSTATQHGEGGASEVFHNALGYDVSNLSDEDIINKIYGERRNVNRYFKNSSVETQNNLKNVRFPNENANALKLLKSHSF